MPEESHVDLGAAPDLVSPAPVQPTTARRQFESPAPAALEPAPVPVPEEPVDHEQEVAAEAEAVAHVVEDDDTLNLPAAPEELIGTQAPSRKRQLISRKLSFKQTLFPVLASQGLFLVGIAVFCFILGDDSPIAEANWIPISLAIIGAVLLTFGVVTMLQIRHQLEMQRALPK